MKTKLILTLFVALLVASCNKPEAPIPELKLSKNEITLEVGQGERIFISGGDGKTYSISPGTTNIAEVNLKGNSLEITAKSVGAETFTIGSAGKTALLKLTVKERPIPNLSSVLGVYGKDNKLLFSYAMKARTKNGLWLCERASNPYGKRIFLSYYMEGSSELLIIAEGLSPVIENTGEQGKKLTITKEKDLGDGKVQLRSGDFRFVVVEK